MRSKLFATTTLTPSSCVPFAAQSRDDPVPYSSPPKMIVGVPSRCTSSPRRRSASSRRRLEQRDAAFLARAVAFGGSIRFLIRTLANVPRIITSWLPRREP
jgi:hypothetical protein